MVQAILSNSEEDKIVAGLTKLITNKRPTCRSIVILELLISWWSKLFLVMVKECLLVYIKNTLPTLFLLRMVHVSRKNRLYLHHIYSLKMSHDEQKVEQNQSRIG